MVALVVVVTVVVVHHMVLVEVEQQVKGMLEELEAMLLLVPMHSVQVAVEALVPLVQMDQVLQVVMEE
jgi:hypothetical protein